MKFFDIEKILISVKKLDYFKAEEENKLTNLKDSLFKTNSCINTDNRNKLDEITNSLTSKMITIKNIHNNNIQVLNNRINEQNELTETNINILNQ